MPTPDAFGPGDAGGACSGAGDSGSESHGAGSSDADAVAGGGTGEASARGPRGAGPFAPGQEPAPAGRYVPPAARAAGAPHR